MKITVSRIASPDTAAYTLHANNAEYTAIETAGPSIFPNSEYFAACLAEIMNDASRVDDVTELDRIPAEDIREYFAAIISR